jgi:fructose-1-phosphate kinase PfkB-like protein
MNNIFDLIFFIVGILIALFMRSKFTIEDEEVEEEKSKQERINIKIEQIEDTYYAWQDNDFIVQAKKVEDVIDHIQQKFPSKNYLIISNRNLDKWLQAKKI